MTPCSPKPAGGDHRTSQHQVLRNDLDGVNLGAVPAFTQLVGIETPIAEQSPLDSTTLTDFGLMSVHTLQAGRVVCGRSGPVRLSMSLHDTSMLQRGATHNASVPQSHLGSNVSQLEEACQRYAYVYAFEVSSRCICTGCAVGTSAGLTYRRSE